jgi:AraC-like DNA-binding protein
MNSEFSLDYRFTVNSPADAHHARVVSDLMESSPNPMGLQVQGHSPYSGRLQMRMFDGIGLMECQLDSPVGSDILFTSERTRPHIARNNSSEFIISIWLGGKNELNTAGRMHNGKTGDFTVTSTDNPFCVHVPQRGHACNISLPASWDRIGDTQLKNTFGNMYPGHNRCYNGLADYARHLLSNQNALALPGASERLYDVIALALNTRATNEHQAGLLALIHNHIDTYYTNPDLDPAMVAAAFDISVRHLHRLFAASNTSFTEYLIGQRLANVQRILADPHYLPQTITRIAFACGFRDINHFGRRFRARYGLTPGEFRRTPIGKKSTT